LSNFAAAAAAQVPLKGTTVLVDGQPTFLADSIVLLLLLLRCP
jgi:hypothetical protein